MSRTNPISTGLRWKFPEVSIPGFQQGFSLMEVIIGVFLSTVLVTGIVQLLGGSVSAYRLQLNQSQMDESGRYARDMLITHISQAGFQPELWQSQPKLPALTHETLDGSSMAGDSLGLQRWSNLNCYGNENPVLDSSGQPEFHVLQIVFRVNTSDNLAITCRYGPDVSQLQTQINNFGLVEGVESMQLLFAEDRDGDTVADGWVTAQSWQQEENIRAVKVALLLSTQHRLSSSNAEQITLLDETVLTPADGRLRSISSLTSAIRGRLK